MKSVTWGPLVGSHIRFRFCTVVEEGSMNNCQLFWYLESETEKQRNEDLNEIVTFQYFLSERQGALKNGYF